MTIRVLIFASLASDIGQRELSLEVPVTATVKDAVDLLSQHYELVNAVRAQLATAVNKTYVGNNCPLSDGDELALIPPVSGG